MKIVIDINHVAHLNFFKNAIGILKDEGHEIFITILNRGRLIKIVEKELDLIDYFISGNYRGGLISIIFETKLIGFFRLSYFVIKMCPDVGLSVGNFVLGMILKLAGKKNYQFDDDPERKVNVFLESLTATTVYFPPITDKKIWNTKNFNALKEWAYLSPKYFTPDKRILMQYGLKEKKYFFIREVSNKSLNYQDQEESPVSVFAHQLTKHKVVLSLENKANISKYPKEWILLQEPIEDIHSLIYYSRLLISSGDSMAREGAMLGIPALYCGFRTMNANRILEDEGMLFHAIPRQIPQYVDDIISGKITTIPQDDFREILFNKWIDVTELIVNLINIKK